MDKDVGDITSEIWLLGDSNPRNWQDVLETPLDPRHPARHSIWTPVLYVIQDKVYRSTRSRIDTSSVYIRNAIEDPSYKPPSNTTEWKPIIESEAEYLGDEVRKHTPIFLFSFGAFAFEFARRGLGEKPKRRYSYWGSRKLGEEFRDRITTFDVSQPNLFPLLHVSIARGKFIESHEYFCGEVGANYFDYVGGLIAKLLVEYRDVLSIWIE